MQIIRIILLLIAVFNAIDRAQAEHSIARDWNEQILRAIRNDSPHPPVHARNLFGLSVVMYDAWAAYDSTAVGYIYRAKHTSTDVAAARREAISYAAYQILKERFAYSKTSSNTLALLGAHMLALGYATNNLTRDTSTAAGVGNAVYLAASNFFIGDGCRQLQGYGDQSPSQGGYVSANPPLPVGLPGTTVVDVNRWQPLAITDAVDQNGFPAGPVQKFQGPQWLGVRTFALTRSDPSQPWINPGPPPQLGRTGDAQFRREVLEVIQKSSQLTPDDGVVIDISPGAYGNNTLGQNDGAGHALNPATGLPYLPNRVKRGDFGRILAEFWADGPNSETPPGHWNVLANDVADHPSFRKRFAGSGPVLDDLEWDVKVYFALNAALHEAACAAWSLKRFYDGGRPIEFIRYMGQLGQATDPQEPSYHIYGLPLVPGLIELVTPQTSRPGGRHERLPVDKTAIFAWAGQPADPTNQYRGVHWILPEDWLPYQKKNFVTPAFPGYISGHSTFSRSAAEILTAITGSMFFPGGMQTYSAPSNTSLSFEKGPSQSVQLQWATYFDASDQAGISRLLGGIHVAVDDVTGRQVGSQCGRSVWALARKYFDGSATPPPLLDQRNLKPSQARTF